MHLHTTSTQTFNIHEVALSPKFSRGMRLWVQMQFYATTARHFLQVNSFWLQPQNVNSSSLPPSLLAAVWRIFIYSFFGSTNTNITHKFVGRFFYEILRIENQTKVDYYWITSPASQLQDVGYNPHSTTPTPTSSLGSSRGCRYRRRGMRAYCYRCLYISICPSVCWSRPWVLQKWLNQYAVWATVSRNHVLAVVYILALPGEYDWTIHARRRCGLSLYAIIPGRF